jgi:hypothetical protein
MTTIGNLKDERSIARQLKKQGLRPAGNDESGWYVVVNLPGDRVLRVWATDEPKARAR